MRTITITSKELMNNKTDRDILALVNSEIGISHPRVRVGCRHIVISDIPDEINLSSFVKQFDYLFPNLTLSI